MSPLYVLGLAGSPRRQGNSETLLDEALSGAQSVGARTEKIAIPQLKISPCRHCGGCLSDARCVLHDDMGQMYEKLRHTDLLILATPVFFLGLPAQTKAFIDRCQALWVERYLLGIRRTHGPSGVRRQGAWIAVAGRKGVGNFAPSRATVRAFFAVCDLEFAAELLFPGVDGYREILKQPEALRRAFELGANLATLA